MSPSFCVSLNDFNIVVFHTLSPERTNLRIHYSKVRPIFIKMSLISLNYAHTVGIICFVCDPHWWGMT